jgi:hypothetical protein
MMDMYGIKSDPIYTEHRKGDVMHSCANTASAGKYLRFIAKEKLEVALGASASSYHQSNISNSLTMGGLSK